MKKISQIASECNVDRELINFVCRKENITKHVVKGKKFLRIEKADEEKIHRILYFEGKISEINLNSKINNYENR